MPGLVTDEMLALLGRPYATATSFPIDRSAIMRWAIAVYYPDPPPPEYWDEEYAATSVHAGIVAPAEFNPFAWMSRRSTTSDAAIEVDPALPRAGAVEHLLGVQPPDLRIGLNAGMRATYTDVPMRPGDEITSTSALAEYTERDGRHGRMLYTTTENRWENQRGELVKTVRMTLIRY